MEKGVNFSPGQTVRYLGRSGINAKTVLLDKRSLSEDVPCQPTENGEYLVEVPIVGKVGQFLGYQGRTANIEIKFSFAARPIVFFGTADDFEEA